MPKLQFILSFLCVSMLIVGCNNNTSTSNNDLNDKVQVEQSSYRPDKIMDNEEIATHLADIAGGVTDVQDAIAVVAGPYAVVAIDIDEQVERQETGKIKYTVLEAMEHDPYGRTAVVIADADMLQRLREMKNSIQGGAPVQGIADELGNIVSRYMPTFPIGDGAPTNDKNNDNLIEKEKGLE